MDDESIRPYVFWACSYNLAATMMGRTKVIIWQLEVMRLGKQGWHNSPQYICVESTNKNYSGFSADGCEASLVGLHQLHVQIQSFLFFEEGDRKNLEPQWAGTCLV